MPAKFEELDYQKTPMGELVLWRRQVPTLDNLEVYEVKLGEEYLMSSMFPVAEIALADLGLQELAGTELDVVVGGLGLGYTAVAALAHPRVRSLLVVETMPAVIGWHQRGLVPLGPKLTGDGRCRLLQGDFFALAASEAGFDTGRQFDAVLLDIDHTPEFFLDPSHAPFYTPEGLRAFARHLVPRGVFAMWSDDAPDEKFEGMLARVFTDVRSHIVTFPNPLRDDLSTNSVYVARAPGSSSVA